MLDKQLIPVDLTKGMDDRSDERLALGGKPTLLSDCVFVKNNTSPNLNDTIQGRDLFTRLATNFGAATGLNGLALFNDELLAVNGSGLYTLDTNANALLSRGTLSNVTLSRNTIFRNTQNQYQPDCASLNGYTCYAWQNNSSAGSGNILGINCQVVDEATGAVVLANAVVFTGTAAFCPRVVAANNAFFILFTDGVGNLSCACVRTAAPSTLVAAVIVAADYSTATRNFDACAVGTSCAVAYPSQNATNSTFALMLTQSAGVVSPSAAVAITTQAQMADTNFGGLAAAAFSSTRWGIYGVANNGNAGSFGAGKLWGAVFTNAPAVSVAAAVIDGSCACLNVASVTAALNGTTMHVFADDYGRVNAAAVGVFSIRRTQVDVTNAIIVAGIKFQSSPVLANGTCGPFIAAKAFVINSTTYLPVFVQEGGSGSLQNAWFLMDTSANVMARALYGSFGWAAPSLLNAGAGPASSFSPATGQVSVPVGAIALLSFASGTNVSLVGLSRLLLKFNTSVPPIRAQLGQNTFFAAAALTAYDGVTPTEAGFFLFPEVVSAADGGAGNVTAGAHGIIALYEVIDGAGQRHQSAPSVAVTYTAPGAKICVVTIPTLFLSGKSNIRIAVFATVAGGSVYYRLNAVNAPLNNTTGTATVTYNFNVSDANLISGELLYTTGGTLPNNAPPPCSILALHQNRLFIDCGDDSFAFQYSQPIVAGFGTQWNETLRDRVEPSGGPIVAMASMDEKLIIFRQRKIAVVYGTGPNSTGAANNYQSPADLPTDVGCVEARSVLSMPMGIVFKAAKGWHLLARDMSIRYIGAAVQHEDANSVSSAVLLDDRQECRFGSMDSVPLIWDYRGDRWSVFSSYPVGDALWWPTKKYYVHIDGIITPYRDTTGASDIGDAPNPTFRTAWLKPGNVLHGFQRVWRLLLAGPYRGKSSLTITVNYDFSSATGATITIADTSVLANAAGNVWECRWHLPVQKCQAIRFQVADTPAVAATGGLGFSSMTLEVGYKKVAYKLPAAQSK